MKVIAKDENTARYMMGIISHGIPWIERELMRVFSVHGYYCFNTNFEKGVDIFAGNGKILLAIEVKQSAKKRFNVYKDRIERLVMISKKFKAKPMFIVYWYSDNIHQDIPWDKSYNQDMKIEVFNPIKLLETNNKLTCTVIRGGGKNLIIKETKEDANAKNNT